MTIMQMIEKRNQAIEAARAFAAAHKNENGVLNDADYAVYEGMEKDIQDISREISRMQREDALEQELSKPMNTPLTSKPFKGEIGGTGRASEDYKNAMLAALRSNFRNVSNVLQEGTDADGGYLVPEEYDKRIIEVLNSENIMRTLGTKIKTGGDHKINIAATKPAASWIEEGEPLVWGDATFDQILLDAHKLHVAIKVTEELLYDNSFGLESYIINLVYALKRPYRKKAAFIMNDKVLATVRTLKDSDGQYLWQQSLKDGEPEKLAGYPVYTSEYAPTGMIAFGDYSYYNIGDRGTRSFKKLTELFAGNDMVGFVAKERVDGKLVLPEAVQILKITAAKSTKP